MSLRRRKKEFAGDQIFLGKITKPHALQGEVKFRPFGSDPFLLEHLQLVHVEDQDFDLQLEYIRGSEEVPILKFKGIDGREAAEEICGLVLWIEENRLPVLPEDEIYESDLLFSRVLNENGEELGTIQEILETGASDVLVVRNGAGNELLLPAIKDVILEIRKAEKTVVVRPLESEWDGVS
ncbi:MAG: ribosome maturation factor RimM [bacterium]